MAPKANYFKIGLFVLIAFALIVTGLALLGAAALFERTYPVVTYMDESVQGLAVGAPVKIRGVEIGKVAEIRLAMDKYELEANGVDVQHNSRMQSLVVVTMNIGVRKLPEQNETGSFRRKRERMRKLAEAGWRVRMASSGITGPPYLEIVQVQSQPMDLTDIPWPRRHERQLYLPSARSREAKIFASIDKLSANLEKADIAGLVTATRTLIDKEMKPLIDNLEIISKNVESMSASLKGAISEDVPVILENVRATTERIDTILERTDKAMTTELRKAMDDLAKTLANLRDVTDKDLKTALKNINATTEKLPETVDRFNAMQIKINRGLPGQLGQVERILGNLEQVTRNLREFSDDTKRYPAHTFFGDPPASPLEEKGD